MRTITGCVNIQVRAVDALKRLLRPAAEEKRPIQEDGDSRPQMLSLSWIKCQGDVWCNLAVVNLAHVDTTGVYIIWHGSQVSRVVRIGQGDIAIRLAMHRKDSAILAYRPNGVLYVTWASVAAHRFDGVQNHLIDQWQPLIGEHFPDVKPIAVNSPW